VKTICLALEPAFSSGSSTEGAGRRMDRERHEERETSTSDEVALLHEGDGGDLAVRPTGDLCSTIARRIPRIGTRRPVDCPAGARTSDYLDPAARARALQADEVDPEVTSRAGRTAGSRDRVRRLGRDDGDDRLGRTTAPEFTLPAPRPRAAAALTASPITDEHRADRRDRPLLDEGS
jgi:hypothetical protein